MVNRDFRTPNSPKPTRLLQKNMALAPDLRHFSAVLPLICDKKSVYLPLI